MWFLMSPQSWNTMEQGHGLSVNYPPQAHVFKHLVPCRWHWLGRLWNLWDPGLSSGKWSLYVRLEGDMCSGFQSNLLPHLPRCEKLLLQTYTGVNGAWPAASHYSRCGGIFPAASHSSRCGWNLPSCFTLLQVWMKPPHLPCLPTMMDWYPDPISQSKYFFFKLLLLGITSQR